MTGSVWLLLEADETAAADRLQAVLALLGIAGEQLDTSALLERMRDAAEIRAVRVLASSAAFERLVEQVAIAEPARLSWRGAVHSAFVFRSDAASIERLTGIVGGSSRVRLRPLDQADCWTVTDRQPALCRSLSGIDAVPACAADEALEIAASPARIEMLISSAAGAGLIGMHFESVPLWLCSAEVIDLDAPLAHGGFDVRSDFLRAVPVVLYLRWACAELGWETPPPRGCLVIDDPVLRPRYGRLHFERLLDAMQRVGFSTSIAFIPMNWRRNEARTVELLRAQDGRLSISVHGCDHTAAEFGSMATDWLAWKSGQALQRMERFAARTGLRYDPVMVFPQGDFSAAAMDVLKRSGFIAAVNTDVFVCAGAMPRLTIGDYWRTALTNYGGFPIFTRRYPNAGIVNFAFDLLLGKPALIVAHHADCRNDCRHVADFAARLNRINGGLRWCSLGDIVRHGFVQRRPARDRLEVEMCSNEIVLRNPGVQALRCHVRKPEPAPESLEQVLVDAQPVDWIATAGAVEVSFRLEAGAERRIATRYRAIAASAFAGESIGYRCRALARRRLSELRDQYLSTLAMRPR